MSGKEQIREALLAAIIRQLPDAYSDKRDRAYAADILRAIETVSGNLPDLIERAKA